MTIPKVNVAAVPPGADAALYLNSLTDQRVVGAYMDFYVSTLGSRRPMRRRSSWSGCGTPSRSPASTD